MAHWTFKKRVVLSSCVVDKEWEGRHLPPHLPIFVGALYVNVVNALQQWQRAATLEAKSLLGWKLERHFSKRASPLCTPERSQWRAKVWVQARWFSWRSHKERSHIWKWWGSDRRAMKDHCIPFTPLSCVLHVTSTRVSMQWQFRWCCVSVLFFFFCLAGFYSNSVFPQCGFTLDTIQPRVWSTGEKAAAAELLLSPSVWSSSDWLTPWLTYL